MTYNDARILIEAYGKELNRNLSYNEIEQKLIKLSELKQQMIKAWNERR